MKLLIVGGVAGGASAATRARRLSEDAGIVLLERGPDVSFANCGLPYYLGGEIAERDKLLVVTPDRLRTRFKQSASYFWTNSSCLSRFPLKRQPRRPGRIATRRTSAGAGPPAPRSTGCPAVPQPAPL